MTQRSSLVVVCLVKAASNEEAGLERGGDKSRKGGMQQRGRGERGKGRTSERSEAVLKLRRKKKKELVPHTVRTHGEERWRVKKLSHLEKGRCAADRGELE